MQRNENLNQKTTSYGAPIQNRNRTEDDKHEGFMTKQIETQTAKIPSGVFLSLAVGCMAVSFGLAVAQGQNKGWANFIGQWAPTFLILGLYNKLVKVHGSEEGAEGTYH